MGRYTHRVAISNNRLLDIEADQVSFRFKDYRDHGQQKTMSLPVDEFIRRFLLHVCRLGSTASAITASKEIAAKKKNWTVAANCWACPFRSYLQSHRKLKITVNGAKNSTGSHCASVRFAAVVIWC